MTELQQKIYDGFKGQEEELIQMVRTHNYDGLVKVPLWIDGVIDWAVFDTKQDKFIYLEYCVGVSGGISFEGDSNGYYDEVEYKKIDL